MNEIILQAEKRETTTKGRIHEMRRAGRVPGVAYGDKEAPLSISVNEKELQAVLRSERGRNALITLKVAQTSHPVLLKEIQRHPITRAVHHVDFHRVSLQKKIEALVPVHVKGEAPGVKLAGGILEHVVRELRVRCLPAEIPASIDVDVTNLQINQSIKAKDLQPPKGVELVVDAESVIVHVVSPTVLEEPTVAAAPGAAAATAEPEVIKKGKTEEGEAAAEAKPAAGGDKKAAASPAAAKPEAKKPEGK
ncbi:MAG TPA: 50S ribosomal protein L25 [Elusimicrobiota bacterium]|nr:50S ribosomal protein L25 [Elusimicrobiota bacterium]